MERYWAFGRKALARNVACATRGCGPARTVGVPTTMVAASTGAMASLPISVTARLNSSTRTSLATNAAVRWSTIFRVLPCIETKGSTTRLWGGCPVWDRIGMVAVRINAVDSVFWTVRRTRRGVFFRRPPGVLSRPSPVASVMSHPA